MKFEIKHRFSGAILFSIETDSWKLAVEAAIKGSANLSYADQILKTVGERPIFQIGPIGSRADYLQAFNTDHGVFVRAGCFWDSLDKFRAAVEETHGESVHGNEYRAAITMSELHAASWAQVQP